MARYQIMSVASEHREVLSTVSGFGEAKKELLDRFNTTMYGGTICTWVNDISYRGLINGKDTTIYIRKKHE